MKDSCIYCGEELASWQKSRSYCTTCKEVMEEAYTDDTYYEADEYEYDPYCFDREDIRGYRDYV